MGSLIQSIDYAAIAPPLIVALTAAAVLFADLVASGRGAVVSWLSVGGLALALVSLYALRGDVRATFCVPAVMGQPQACSYVVNEFTLVLQLLVLGGALLVVLLSRQTVADTRLPVGEYHFLLLCSAAGAATLVASRDLISLVIALEVVSLPAFGLVGLRRNDGRASESALKFFLVSIVSSAVMLYGISLVYGMTGTVFLGRVAAALGRPEAQLPVTAIGVVLTLAGFAFKVSAVPFHFWVPDTYVGAPIPVAAYLSVVSKAAGLAGLLLVVALGFRPYTDVWAPVMAVLAAASMTVGNLVALRQRHAVRLLAWSSVAQGGFMLVPLGALTAGGGDTGEILSATVAYLLIYGVMNLGAFACVTVVARHRPAQLLSDYRALARTEPVTALSLAFFLACLAGLPPGVVGLFAKIVVFRAAVDGGLGWLAVVMAVNTVIALYYYLSWAAQLFALPDPQAPPPSYRIPADLGVALGVALGLAVVLSVLPQAVLAVLTEAASLL
jgi:NADH-quinone oxidoreductase subunit N